jgi:hypothetical protein
MWMVSVNKILGIKSTLAAVNVHQNSTTSRCSSKMGVISHTLQLEAYTYFQVNITNLYGSI